MSRVPTGVAIHAPQELHSGSRAVFRRPIVRRRRPALPNGGARGGGEAAVRCRRERAGECVSSCSRARTAVEGPSSVRLLHSLLGCRGRTGDETYHTSEVTTRSRLGACGSVTDGGRVPVSRRTPPQRNEHAGTRGVTRQSVRGSYAPWLWVWRVGRNFMSAAGVDGHVGAPPTRGRRCQVALQGCLSVLLCASQWHACSES